MRHEFVIDCFPESAVRYADHAIVAVDVIRATTMAITAVELGYRCYPVPSLEAALQLARELPDALLAGEQRGDVPDGFDMNNSPALLEAAQQEDQPLILLSSSGTKLLHTAMCSPDVYLGCLRNYTAAAQAVAEASSRIALIGAGSRGEFREEDQLCCAWIGIELQNAGFVPADQRTAAIVRRWTGAPVSECASGHSADYLRRTHQEIDLEFILTHVDDLQDAFLIEGAEVVKGVPVASAVGAD